MQASLLTHEPKVDPEVSLLRLTQKEHQLLFLCLLIEIQLVKNIAHNSPLNLTVKLERT